VGAFLIILGLPAVGLLLYLGEHVRRHGMTPTARYRGRIAVLALGVLLILAGTLTLLAFAGEHAASPSYQSLLRLFFDLLTQFIAGGLMLWAGWAALRVRRLPVQPDFTSGRIEREDVSEHVRLAAITVALIPLVLLGVFALVIVVPLLLWGVASRTSRRARQSQFLWTMALAIRHRLPLAEEVEAFAEPLWAQQKAAYRSLADRLRDGISFGEALELSNVLPAGVAGEIRSAEEAGVLSQVMEQLALSTTVSLVRHRPENSLAMTFVYSWSLLAAVLLVIGFITYWIIPKFKAIFADFGVELPPLAMSLVVAGDLLEENFAAVMFLLGLPVIAGLLGFLVYVKEWGNLNFPLLMRWFPRRDAPSLLRSLSHIVDAQRPLSPSLGLMSERQLRSDLRGRILRIRQLIDQGSELWTALAAEGLLNRREADALAAAQRAGNLPWAMRTLADSMENRRLHRTRAWLEILRPAVVILMGMLVGWFVVGMFLPMVYLISALS
jgi:type II secretory pathway component PulF